MNYRPTLSIVALGTANLVPLAGVIWLGWDAAVIVLLYWTENIIIGFYNILKMALLKMDSIFGQFGKIFAIPFFCIHFGGFCAVHGFFLLIIFKIGGDPEGFLPQHHWPGPLIFVGLLVSVITALWRDHPKAMDGPVVALFISHGISFVQNYLGGKEYLDLTINKLMSMPYKRVVIMHVAIIIGGMLVMMWNSPVPLLCMLVLIKLCLDIYLHVKEHKQ